jgi:hypothetical protein
VIGSPGAAVETLALLASASDGAPTAISAGALVIAPPLAVAVFE